MYQMLNRSVQAMAELKIKCTCTSETPLFKALVIIETKLTACVHNHVHKNVCKSKLTMRALVT